MLALSIVFLCVTVLVFLASGMSTNKDAITAAWVIEGAMLLALTIVNITRFA